MSLKSQLKQNLPSFVMTGWRIWELFLSNVYDLNKFLKWSDIRNKTDSKNKLLAHILKDYHKIEKGLALPSPRVGFGMEYIPTLIKNIKTAHDLFGEDKILDEALASLKCYINFNDKALYSSDQFEKTKQDIRVLSSELQNTTATAGASQIDKSKILLSSKVDLENFFNSRHSIRQFSSEDVDPATILKAVELARKTPSVCNRQSVHIYACNSQPLLQQILSIQGGNKGFTDTINTALIVTSDLQSFMEPGERNQCWVDGGLFAMSVVYALHSLGIGSCMLNWSKKKKVDKKLREVIDIPASQNIITFIALGHYPDKLTVADSSRTKSRSNFKWLS